MRGLNYANPFFVWRNRRLVPVYARNYARDAASFARDRWDVLRVSCAHRGLAFSPNDRRFAALRDLHKGRRCFVIGTGPSLTIQDLNRLHGEITFASNRIYACFGETDWRPTYYATSYLQIYDHYYEDIDAIEKSVKFLPLAARTQCPPVRNAIYYRRTQEWFPSGLPHFSFNALKTVYWGGSITYEMIQLAVYMGIREVYFLGVDADYRIAPGSERNPGEEYTVTRDTGHFHPGYARPGEKDYFPVVDLHLKAYQSAGKALESLGGHIYNASRGGKLELFPRVNLDSLLVGASQ